MDKQLSLFESFMSRKGNEFSDISQVYFREKKKELTEVISKSSSLLDEVTKSQSSM